jgi:hypothetical protein
VGSKVDTVIRCLLKVSIILIGLAPWGYCHAATFSSANIDFLGRGRACGLVASPGDFDNMLANPSLLGRYRSERSSIFAAFMDYIGGLRGGALGYGARGGQRWGYGTYVTYLTSGSIPLATWDDPVGGSGEDFSYTELGGGFLCGVEVSPYLLLGGSVKVIREALDDDASTAAICDLGGTVRIHGFQGGAGHAVYACILGRNVVRSAWNTESDEPAPGLEIGLALDLSNRSGGRFSTGCSFSAANHGIRQLSVGLSGLISDEFGARIGYKRQVGTSSDASYGFPWQRGLIAGFSVSLGKFWVDYAYEDASPLDNIHRIGLRVLPNESAPAR